MHEPSDRESPLNRRDLLRTVVAAGVASSLGSLSTEAEDFSKPQRDLIRAENEKAGTTSWLLEKTRIDPKTKYRCPWIEGYCSHTSIRAGETLNIMVSTNPASSFVLDLYRLGYYQGKGGRHLVQLGPFKGKVQPDPEIGTERLRECRWEPAATLTIPKDWPSGVYLGKLTAERDKLQSYIIFIVRDDRACDFLFQCSDTTWSAYNRWPSQWSLYDDGKKEWYWGPGVRVSWDRPYGKYCQIFDAPLSQGSGEFLLWEFPLAFWMEKEGYDVSYISNVDTHTDAKGLLRAKGFLSVGHDEYWSLDMFKNVKAAIAAGVNAAFLSGNTCCGVISFLPSGSKTPNRIISRIGQYGPIQEESVKKGFPELRDLKHNGPNEATLMGARSTFPVTGGADWICVQDKHWLFAGTGMKNGDSIPGLVGWEWHGDPADIPGLEVVAKGQTFNGTHHGTYTATIYPGPKNNLVFNAATIWWSDGLSAPPGYLHPAVYGAKPKGPDARVQRITANLLNRFRAKM
ncbi:MAG TPA: N,N-dimethylformamidase beta subunit family domain-containing protein [Gemmataceae bacterium]|nr:N,N-dimethylformamidase beta subunit family domain-containing protein [Gemmataceae bacterium]